MWAGAHRNLGRAHLNGAVGTDHSRYRAPGCTVTATAPLDDRFSEPLSEPSFAPPTRLPSLSVTTCRFQRCRHLKHLINN